MQILLEATPHYLNMGDLAMLKVAVGRLRSLWPEARIAAFTSEPDRLAEHCPGVDPVLAASRDIWLQSQPSFGRGFNRLPPPVRRSAQKIETYIWRRMPRLFGSILSRSRARDADTRTFLDHLHRVLSATDLFVICGMGSYTSAFEPSVNVMIETIELTNSFGIPSVAVGQGIGPFDKSSRSWQLARKNLPLLKFLGLRKGARGPALVAELGVAADRVKVTGDEAIEVAYRDSQAPGSNLLGVCMRSVPYAGVAREEETRVAATISKIARKLGAELTAVPISHVPEESDLETFVRMFPSQPSRALTDELRLTPEWIVNEIGRCRVVVTGAYHAAVFAASQGIPSISLPRSQYYRDKFDGLAAQFGPGCEVVSLDQPDFEDRLGSALERMWTTPCVHRDQLLGAARRQISESKAAWSDLATKVRPRRFAREKSLADADLIRTWYRRRGETLARDLQAALAYIKELERTRDWYAEQATSVQLERTIDYLRKCEEARDWHRAQAEGLEAQLRQAMEYLAQVEQARDWHCDRANRLESEHATK
jgi:polysaccharide pyruvyl transferase WcaK-like protein